MDYTLELIAMTFIKQRFAETNFGRDFEAFAMWYEHAAYRYQREQTEIENVFLLKREVS